MPTEIKDKDQMGNLGGMEILGKIGNLVQQYIRKIKDKMENEPNNGKYNIWISLGNSLAQLVQQIMCRRLEKK